MLTLIVGCNHRTAPLDVRERLALSSDQARGALHVLRATYPQCEGLILSTCNRVELYLARPDDAPPDCQRAIELLAGFGQVDPSRLAGLVYAHTAADAIRHCFRVVSSLDSMVLGESQIVGQARQALVLAEQAEAVGPTLQGVFSRALAVARRVRTETGIAAGRVSVGSLAVDFARRIFARLERHVVLMIGAGKIGRTTVRHLQSQGPHNVLVTNRTPQRAEELARLLGARAVPFARLADHLATADIVISCTGAAEPVVTREAFEPVLRRRGYRPILIIDIAVPRDVEPAVGAFDQVYLYNIDDLQGIVDATLADRRAELAACTAIIEQELAEFLREQQSRDVAPVVAALRERLDEIAEQELQWALPKLTDDAERNRQIIEQFKHRLLQKILHRPVTQLTERARNGSAGTYAELLRELFDLPGKE